MKIPFKWLKTFVALTASAEEVSDALTMRGLEVEGLERISQTFSGVYTANIVSVEMHPSADKLHLCRVDTGEEVIPIVCGAPNVAVGQKVALALPSGQVSGMTIEKRTLRGVESFGMLCSERELGLSDEHGGILTLPDETLLGKPLQDILEVDDFVLEVNVPPNRGDCQSVLGIAREVGSAFDLPIVLPSVDFEEGEDINNLINLSILDSHACPRYVLRLIKGISIRQSPYWMRTRIIKAGMRPINSIVDVTNYIMLELGQPLHAFDYSTIGLRTIEVRVAQQASVFRTLDGVDRKIEPEDILIYDGKGPIAIAGVMGGENSEINVNTDVVALESAFFNPLFIRRTARRLDLRSEASIRFEKGIDISNADYCARRAIDLMQRTSGGAILRGSKEFYTKRTDKFVSLNFAKASEIIGTEVKSERVLEILSSLGLTPEGTKKDSSLFLVPSYRHDIDEDFDLIEEVARIVGYANIPPTVPVGSLLPVTRNKLDIDTNLAKDFLCSCGLYEVINFGFFSSKDVEKLGIPSNDTRFSTIDIMNPISKELNVMRSFLTPGILENLTYNINRGTKNFGIFEIGKVYFTSQISDLADEHIHLCCALTGKERDYFWRDSFKPFDFFDLKGIIESLFSRLGLSFSVSRSTESFLDITSSADVFLNNMKIGWLGQIKDSVLNAYDIKDIVFCSEIDFGIVSDQGSSQKTYRPIPRFPAMTRDFSFYVDDSITVSSIIDSIKEVSPLIVSVGVFDLFKKEEKSISFRVVFQSFDETLTDEVVNEVQQTIILKLTKDTTIRLRT
jgi:phenylalanyl-tRNA synthetase beta chain